MEQKDDEIRANEDGPNLFKLKVEMSKNESAIISVCQKIENLNNLIQKRKEMNKKIRQRQTWILSIMLVLFFILFLASIRIQ